MSEVTKVEGLERENDLLYNEKYYQNYNGDNYGRNEKWFSFFGNIADLSLIHISEPTRP